MKHTRMALAALAATALLAACDNTAEVEPVRTPTGGQLFSRYVAIGNSITAGFQSGGLNDSTQRESYAAYLAQRMGLEVGRTGLADFIYPSFPEPGCPSPINNFQTQTRVGAPNNPPCTLRAIATELVSNVAVPGATVADPTSTAGNTTSSAVNQFILGGRSQVDRALMSDPTFVSIWIGNNDVLAAGVSGVLTPAPGISPGVTPLATFQQRYDAMLTALTTAEPELEGVLIGVVQVANAPVLFPAPALFNPQFKAGFDQFAGGAVTLLPTCTPTSSSLISFAIISAMRAGTHPRIISCDKTTATPAAPIGEVFVLDAQDQAALSGAINAYNAHIQAKANQLGWAYFDPNPTLAALRANGSIPAVPNLASATSPYGDFISLDGVHPRRAAHVRIANELVTVINAKYGTTLTPVDATTGGRPVQVTH